MHQILDLPKIPDPRGNLTFLQHPNHLPFQVRRVFWTYDIPGGESRGGHAFHKQEELIIALSGSFDVIITDAEGVHERIVLNRSYYGLYLSPGTWRHIENFSTNSLALHLSSTTYDAADYVYDFEAFKKWKS